MNKISETLPLFANTEADLLVHNPDFEKVVSKDSNAQSQWEKCLRILRDNVSSQVYNTWFTPIKPIRFYDNLLTVQVPSQFFYEWIEQHYYDLLQKTLWEIFGDKSRLQYEVVVDNSSETLDKRTINIPAFQHEPVGKQASLSFALTANEKKEVLSFLNPRYSFDNFITGESNQLASSAAKAVAGNPGGTSFNPILIYGSAGMGKTHLVQAIGNFIKAERPNVKVLYSNSERFTMEFVQSIEEKKTAEFSNFYRDIDVLIIDDIQFFKGKEKTQDNFFHTFNALHQAGKQIILTSDVSPKELSGVEERLISRFQWGLNVDIQKPELETRMAILNKKATNEGIELPYDVIQYIAQNITGSIRELEGTLISLIAKHTLDRKEININLAKEVINGMTKKEDKEFTIEDIKEIVASYYNLSLDVIESKSRKHEIALARQMCMYLAKRFTNLSLKAIGSHFGGRDHSTVLHSCTAIDNYLDTDKRVRTVYEQFYKECKNRS